MSSHTCLGCLLASMGHKRCLKAKDKECATYVDHTDPGYLGNLPLEDLVSHIEGGSAKKTSKRRKFKLKKQNEQKKKKEETETVGNEEVLIEENVSQEDTKVENKSDSEEWAEDVVHEAQSAVDHLMTEEKEHIATERNKNLLNKEKKRTADASYFDQTDPDFLRNLPLDDLVSHIEASTTKKTSKRRKFKLKKQNEQKMKDEAAIVGNHEALIDDNGRQEEAKIEEIKCISRECSGRNVNEAPSKNQIPEEKKPITTERNKNISNKEKMQPDDPSSTSSTKKFKIVPVDVDSEGLVSDEEYLRNLFNEEEYQKLMSVLNDPRSGIDPSHIRNFQRQYPLDYLYKLNSKFLHGDLSEYEVEEALVGIQKKGTKGDNESLDAKHADVVLAKEEKTAQKSCENISVVQRNSGHQMTREKQTTTVTKTNNTEKGLKKGNKASEPSGTDPFEKRSGAIVSDEEYMKALLADEELYGYATTLKKANSKFNGKQLFEIQEDYPLDYLMSLRRAVQKYTSGLPTNTILDGLSMSSLEAMAKAFEKQNEEDGSGDMLQKTSNPDDVKEILKYPNCRLDTCMCHEEHTIEDEIMEELECEHHKKKRKRFEAMKNRRNKKAKETNTFVVDQAAPGYVGNLSVADILEHIESKPLTNARSKLAGGERKSEKPQKKKENAVDTDDGDHPLVEMKNATITKKDKKKTTKQNTTVRQLAKVKEIVTARKGKKDTKKQNTHIRQMVEMNEVEKEKKETKKQKTPTKPASTDLVEELDFVSKIMVRKSDSCLRSIKERLKDLPHDPEVKKYLDESETTPHKKTNSQLHLETKIDPAECAIYGQFLKYYYMDKEKENEVSSSFTESPESEARLLDFQLLKSEATRHDRDDEKAWLDYSNRKIRHCNSHSKETERTSGNFYSGVFGRATEFDFSLFDLD